jgi:NTP pyrophosphatase (non-canonical NTP hydrolase)
MNLDLLITDSTADAINAATRVVHEANVAKGWWTNLETGEPLERDPLNLICLMHSELSEACEGERKNLKDDHLPEYDSVAVEMADCVIRIMDFCGSRGIPLGTILAAKHGYNQRREDHKLENRKKEGGKRY